MNVLGHYQPATGGFSSGLCDCCSDSSSCLLTFLCPCVAFGRIAEIVDRGSTSCCAAGSCYAVLAMFIGFQWLYTCNYRSKMKDQFRIPSTTKCNDCCTHFWCHCCALAQEYREIKFRGYNPALGWEGNLNKATTTMVPPVAGGMFR